VNRAVCALCLLLAFAIGVAGCGGASESTGSDGTGATSSKNKSAADEKPKKGIRGVVFGAEGEAFGIILYDLSGHTLYTFSKDKKGASTCYGACAKTWPPTLTEGKPRAGGEAIFAKVGTTNRKDGTVQLTYAGHPLYTHVGEKQGDSNGNALHAFGGEWYAIRPNGEKPAG
jgi:predicted lipoprotein with Yx(FWY)xxD motif